jgi:hypothetical protein
VEKCDVRAFRLRGPSATAVGVLISGLCVLGFQPASPPPRRAAVPAAPIPALLDAFTTHSLVAVGDAHGNQQGLALQIELIRTPAFLDRVDDVLIELGNSRYQDILDRYVRGEDVPEEMLVRVWRDTAQQHVAPWRMPDVIRAVRDVNQKAPSPRRLRVLAGEPPLDWAAITSADDLRAAQSAPGANRDVFAADLIRREVLAKGRRALALYGAGHFFRKNVTHSIVSLLEAPGDTQAFTVWTNAAADMTAMQSDVRQWPVPSLAMVRGTVLGSTPFETYFGRFAADMPAQW